MVGQWWIRGSRWAFCRTNTEFPDLDAATWGQVEAAGLDVRRRGDSHRRSVHRIDHPAPQLAEIDSTQLAHPPQRARANRTRQLVEPGERPALGRGSTLDFETRPFAQRMLGVA